jgi:glutathione S-transferase
MRLSRNALLRPSFFPLCFCSALVQAFFEKNFPELKGSIPQGGYPDCGSGKYAQKLSVAEWQDFNNAQRAHLNYVEGAATIIIALVVAGLFQPRLTAVLGAVYIVGRFLYALGYKSGGPKGRLVGVLLLDLALLSAIGVGAYCSFQAAGGVKGALDLVQHVVRLDLWQ